MRDISLITNFIPLDKSWIIRMGILDIVNGYDDIVVFLNNQEHLGDDLVALKHVAKIWKTDEPLDVGESGTLYRFLKFASWKLHLNKKFILKGTLKERKINDDPSIVDLPQEKLLTLDNNTSQWASAAVLLGDEERLENPPHKLKITYDAVAHWNEKRSHKECWAPLFDETILNQAKTYVSLLESKENIKDVVFTPEQAEDFCFAYVFGYMSAEEGEKRWPSLRTHESDRIQAMEEVLTNAKEGKPINSHDHRVVQAIAMWSKVYKKEINILHPEAVNKTWPQFWNFLEEYK